MKLKINETFRFAHGGTHIVEYEKGREIDAADEELIAVATREQWAVEVKGSVGKSKAADGNLEPVDAARSKPIAPSGA